MALCSSTNKPAKFGTSRGPFSAEDAISHILRFGVILCAMVIGFGLLLSWVLPHPSTSFSTADLHQLLAGRLLEERIAPTSFTEFIEGLALLDPSTVISLGLILLILLPITRVALTIIVFLIECDFLYFGITSLVFLILLLGMTLGKTL